MLRAWKHILLLSLFFAAFASQTASAAEPTEQGPLAALLQQPGPLKVDGIPLDKKRLLNFYEPRSFKAVWIVAPERFLLTNPQFRPNAHLYQQLFMRAAESGLTAEDYYPALLEQRLSEPFSAERALETELLLSDLLMQYISDLRIGRVHPGEIDRENLIGPQQIDASRLLEEAAVAPDPALFLAMQEPPHLQYRQLKTALAQLRNIAAAGGWPELPTDKRYAALLQPGKEDPRLPLLVQRLAAEGYLPPDTVAPIVYDETLVHAVKRFQSLHKLESDGIIGARTWHELNLPAEERAYQVALNMERWRWLPRDLGPRHIRVNVAGFTLSAVENGQEALSMPVIVGKPNHHTPVMHTEMTQVVFHPYWYAPPRLSYEYVRPKIMKNAGAASHNGYELFYRGESGLVPVSLAEVNLSAMDRGDFRHYVFRQRPGPRNALGPVKFQIQNTKDIYMHGTNSPHLFDQEVRAESSGCIRVGDPEKLATFVLARDDGWPAARVEEVYRQPSSQPRYIPLKEAIPVYLTYHTVWYDPQEGLRYSSDLYEKDMVLANALHDLTETRLARLTPARQIATNE